MSLVGDRLGELTAILGLCILFFLAIRRHLSTKELCTRQIWPNDLCPLACGISESTIHALRECTLASTVWTNTTLNQFSQENPSVWLQLSVKVYSRVELDRVSCFFFVSGPFGPTEINTFENQVFQSKENLSTHMQ